MKKSLLSNIVLSLFVFAVLAWSVKVLIESPPDFLSSTPSLSILQAREKKVLQETKTAQWKAFLQQEKYRQAYRNIPHNALLWRAFWVSCIAMFAGSGLIIAIGLSAGIFKICKTNSETFALLLSRRKISDQEWKAAIAAFKLREAELKQIGMSMKGLPAINIETTDKQIFSAPEASECLRSGLMQQDSPYFFLGTNRQNGEHEYLKLLDANTDIKIAGKKRFGKSNTKINIIAQSIWKGYLQMWFCLHHPHKESFISKLGTLAQTSNVRYYDNKADVITGLNLLNSLIDGRMAGTLSSETPIIVGVDELKGLYKQLIKEGIDCSIVFERIVDEGSKINVILIVTSHTWRAEDVGSTAFRDGIDYTIAHKMDARQATTFFHDKDIAKQCTQLKKGQTMTMTDTGETLPLSIPLWTSEAIQHIANTMVVTEFQGIESQELYTGPKLVYSNEQSFWSKLKGFK